MLCSGFVDVVELLLTRGAVVCVDMRQLAAPKQQLVFDALSRRQAREECANFAALYLAVCEHLTATAGLRRSIACRWVVA